MKKDSEPGLSLFWIKSSFFTLLLLVSVFIFGFNNVFVWAAGKDMVFTTISLSAEALSVSPDLAAIAQTLKSKYPKLDTAMARLVDAAAVSMDKAVDLARSESLRLSDSRVHVQIITDVQKIEDAVQAITEAGGEVTGVSRNKTLIQAWLPIDAVKTIIANDNVYMIRRPMKAILLEGDSTSEGVSVINAPAWHTAGYAGSGVKVGIIDGGFKGYTGLLGTDLPSSVTVKNFVDGETDAEVNATTPHGTACSEVIYDIAPDTEIFLAKINTNLDLEEAVAWLKDTHHVDIISTSLGFYNATPGDGTGEFADLVSDARSGGILWTTAAGNDREYHWGGPWSDPDSDDVLNFNGTQEINYFAPGEGYWYLIPAGYHFCVYARWDDWDDVNQDFDLWLLRWNGSSWDIISKSENGQNGGPGQTPTEEARVTTFGASAPYGFLIKKSSATRSVNFEIFAPKINRLDEILHARSLCDLADAPDAMTVAAVDVNTHLQESYSSEGPTNGPGGTATGGFTKPDISAYANVSTESYKPDLPYRFNGTSAATPHVAGAAALVLSAFPSFSPDQLQSFLENRAIDMGSPGMDNQFGHGRLYLGVPPSIICPWLVFGQTTIDHNWKYVTLANTLQNAVYILGPPTYHGTDPGVVRLQNVTNNSFDIRFQEWLYKDGAHTHENIPYLALSSGRHNMPDGSIWEADTFSLSGTGAWTSQSFNSSFPSTPALFLTAQTYNGWHPITVRARDVTNTGFEAALFEEENKMDGHVTEEIGYLAVYSPQLSGTVNINGTDIPYLLQAQSVDHRFVPVLSSNIKLEEEQSKDSEVNHIDETISILALGDKIFTQDISSDGGDTAAIRRLAPEYGAAMEWGTVDGVDHNWIKIPLAKEYLNPVVVAKPVSSLGGDPGVIRVRNVSHNSFELRYNEWLYKDGSHIQERVFYMVVEAGIRSVAGLTVEARRLNTSKLLADGWEPITFSAFFSQTPSVFTSVQTYNGVDPVTTRLSNCSAAGFNLTMDEEEAKNDGHTTETIGWIAIKRGTGNTNDNRSVVVLSSSTNHIPTQINFGQSMARRFPVVVSDMITTYGVDPGFLRYQNLGPGSIDLFIQEEASSDPEMNHVVENVSVFVGG